MNRIWMPLSRFESLVLMALAKDNPLTITDIRRYTGISPSAIYNAVRRLKSRGLVVENREKSFPFSRLIIATEKGLRIGRLLHELEKALRS